MWRNYACKADLGLFNHSFPVNSNLFLLPITGQLQFMPAVTGCEDGRHPGRSPTPCRAQAPSLAHLYRWAIWEKKAGVKVKQRENHTEVSITTKRSHGACFCRHPIQCFINHASEGHLTLILNSIMPDHSVLYAVCTCEPSGELEVKSCSWFYLKDVHHVRHLRGLRYAGGRFTVPPSPSQMCRAHQYKWHLQKIFDYSEAGAQTW